MKNNLFVVLILVGALTGVYCMMYAFTQVLHSAYYSPIGELEWLLQR
jgi:hypothetical protein